MSVQRGGMKDSSMLEKAEKARLTGAAGRCNLPSRLFVLTYVKAPRPSLWHMNVNPTTANRPGEPVTAASDHPARLGHPSRLCVETTTRCNLSCAMCVKQTPGNGVGDADMAPEVFDSLVSAFRHLDALVLNGVGEPLLHPQLDDFVRRARREVPDRGWIGFQTNGLLLTPERATTLVGEGVDRICLSVDSADPATFRRMRAGGLLDDVARGFDVLAHASQQTRTTRFRAGAEVVVTRETVSGLPDVVRWAARRGARFILVSHLMPYSGAMHGREAYPSFTDRSLELYFRWRDRAAREQGVNLDDCLNVMWSWAGVGADRRVLPYALGMQEEAGAMDMWLRPPRLARRDQALMDRVDEAFGRAREVAIEEGIDLTLPASKPTFERRCDFVERGTTFVAWDGSVHPCYFLWHRYTCHLDGRAKPVSPMPFGTVNGRGVGPLWDSPEYRAFRDEVLRYDWPYCLDCVMTPCDLIESETFSHDCYGYEVPCGDCPWALGLLNCLS